MKEVYFTEIESWERDLFYNEVEVKAIKEIKRLISDQELQTLKDMTLDKVMDIIDDVIDNNRLNIK